MAIQLITTKLGPLTVRVVDDPSRAAPPALACVLCHGYGAPGTDLVGLARECFVAAPALVGRVRFVFPEAPQETEFGGRMWWPIDMMAVQDAMQRRDARFLAGGVPAGLPQARKQLTAMLEALLSSTKLPMSKVVLGGFSQGAMLTTDVALRLDEAPAALAVLSGALVSEDEWKKLAAKRKGLTVLQSHGRQDPVLPWKGAELLQTLLKEAGAHVEFVGFDGGHGIDGDVVDALAALLQKKAG